MATRSNAYWDKRALERMALYHRDADRVVATIAKAYDKGLADILGEVENIFRKFTKDGGLTDKQAKKILNEPISRKEWELIKEQIKDVKDSKLRRRLLNRLNAPAYRARISRLEALKANIYVQSKIIADVEIQASTQGYTTTIQSAYNHTIFDVQKGLGAAFEFASMPNRVIETILKNPWSGEHFSSRVWGNTDILAQHLNEIITAGFESGIGSRKMAKELRERMDVGKHVANRLVRTETTYMTNAAEIESYKELDIEKYIFLATLDLRTSKTCQEMDLKEFFVKDAKAGVNLPPMHVFCRSTTRAKIDVDDREGIMRRARNPITGKNDLIPAGMNYKEWYRKYVKGNTTDVEPKVESKKQITTAEEARKALVDEVGFLEVEESFLQIDESLQISNTEQLIDLENKFGAIKQSKSVTILSGDKGPDTYAYVSSSPTNPSIQNLSLSSRYYNDRQRLIDSSRTSIESGWSMPARTDDKTLSVYSVTHEYGHVMQNVLITKRMESMGWESSKPFAFLDLKKKSSATMNKWYTDVRSKVQNDHFNEIVNIAKTKKPDFNLMESISGYGKTNKEEFFAEVFANSQLGKPNILGEAMNTWLQEKGLILK